MVIGYPFRIYSEQELSSVEFLDVESDFAENLEGF